MEIVHRVVLIVDRSCGEKLADWLSGDAVWIVGTAENMPAVRQWWSLKPNLTQFDGITSFTDNPALSPDELAESMIDTIELHHGAYSHDPPMTTLEIVGCDKTAKLVMAVEEIGFTLSEERDGLLEFIRTSLSARRT